MSNLSNVNIADILVGDSKTKKDIFDALNEVVDMVASLKKEHVDVSNQINSYMKDFMAETDSKISDLSSQIQTIQNEDKITPVSDRLNQEIQKVKSLIPVIPEFPTEMLQEQLDGLKSDMQDDSTVTEMIDKLQSDLEAKIAQTEKKIVTSVPKNVTQVSLLGGVSKNSTKGTLTIPTIFNSAEFQQILTDGATINWNMNAGGMAKVILGGNRTVANPTNTRNGATYILEVIQDGTGSRTITWGSNFIWSGGSAPTLTTTLNKRDVITFVCSNGKLYGSAVLNFI